MGVGFWLVLVLLLTALWGSYAGHSLYIAKILSLSHIKTIQDAGAWGDSFGAFNGLVSLAGAIFVVRTLSLQQDSLSEQRKALALQAADAHKQRFEATFFELLKLLRELRSELSFVHSSKYILSLPSSGAKTKKSRYVSGTDALLGFILELLQEIRLRVDNPSNASRKDISESFEKIMNTQTEKTFAPYFRIVYTILNRIRHDNVLTDNEKNNYSRLLRSQLTNVELMSLAYNALSPRSADLEVLLTSYRMLKYMPDSPGRRRFEKIYDPVAFLPRD